MTKSRLVPARLKGDWVVAATVLTFLLIIAFAPVVLGQRHLMLSGWDIHSILNGGAYDPVPSAARVHTMRTPDPWAPAWTIEPWFKLISEQYWDEFNLPLWNPFNAFGTPLAATAQPQPFFPLTALLSLHVSAWTYSLFILARLLLGGLLTYFFARQFLSSLPSLFAAIAFMLSGHFITFLNMPEVSVEVLTPGLFLAFEILARRNSWAGTAGVAAAIFLISTGGMPESMFLIVSFGCLYFICRVFFDAELHEHAASLSIKFLAAILLGFALSAFILVPFVELLHIAFDLHQPSNNGGGRYGLAHDAGYSMMIEYLLPLIFGPPLDSVLPKLVYLGLVGWTGLRGYWGIVAFFFAIAAVLLVVLRRRSATRHEPFLIIFFSVTLALMVLKRFGSWVINWIGTLPLSEMVLYAKYQEPLIALCVAMLAGIGFSSLIERRATSRLLLLAGLGVLAMILVAGGRYLPRILAEDLDRARIFYFTWIGFGVSIVIITTLLALLVRLAPSNWHPWVARGVVGLLSLELLSNFLLPCFYLIGSLPPARVDPYAGAPYIDFLRRTNTDHARVFARENLLFPNWSSAFGLADVRNLDALHYGRYREFMRSFLLPPYAATRVAGDLGDRFIGAEFPYEFDTEAERRFLALSSVRYLITKREYGGWLKKIYSGEALVYEVPNILPRAALFHAIEVVPDDAALARLKNPSFNVYEKAVVSRESVSTGLDLSGLIAGTPATASIARITNYQSQHVTIEAETAAPALLVLNDSNYPGWSAYLNGQPVETLTANYLFRGVVLPPGKSIVEFKYQPRSFAIGSGISISAFAMLVVLVWRERHARVLKRERSRPFAVPSARSFTPDECANSFVNSGYGRS